MVVGGLSQRVHLEESAVVLAEQLVQLLHDRLGLGVRRGAGDEAQRSSEESAVGVGDAHLDVDGLLEDQLRSGLGNVLDGSTTRRGGNEDRATGSAVKHDGDIHLSAHVHSLGKHDFGARKTLLGGLLGDQVLSQHLRSELLNISGLVAKVDATLESIGEVANIATTGKNHCLNNAIFALANDIVVQLHNLVHRCGHATLGNWDTEASEDIHRNLVKRKGRFKFMTGIQGAAKGRRSAYIFVNVQQSATTKSGRAAEKATASSTDSNGRLQ